MVLSLLFSGLCSCKPKLEPVFIVRDAVNEVIPSVVHVSWKTNQEGPAFVRFATDLSEPMYARASVDDEDTWSATLVGLPPNSSFAYQIQHGEVRDSLRTGSTGSAPDWVLEDPTLEGEGVPGFLVTGMRTPDQHAAVIVDALGRAVWWYPIDAFGSAAYTTRVTLLHDDVWFNIIKLRTDPEDADARLGVVRVSLDGSDVEHIALDGHHHDFVVHEDGRLVYLSAGEDGIDDVRVREVDGSIGVLWSAAELAMPEGEQPWLNSIEYVEETHQYWVGAKEPGLIAVLDAKTGALVGQVGGEGLAVDDPFVGQHGFEVQGDTLWLFDNGAVADDDSRGVRYALDWEAGTATAEWIHSADPRMYSTFLGDTLPVGDGRILVNWTSRSFVHQVDEAGEVVSRWTYAEGEMLTYMRWVEAILPPE